MAFAQVIVKSLVTGSRLILKSVKGLEILKTKIHQDKFIVAHTPETLLLGHLETCLLSEIAWRSDPQQLERFCFSGDKVKEPIAATLHRRGVHTGMYSLL